MGARSGSWEQGVILQTAAYFNRLYNLNFIRYFNINDSTSCRRIRKLQVYVQDTWKLSSCKSDFTVWFKYLRKIWRNKLNSWSETWNGKNETKYKVFNVLASFLNVSFLSFLFIFHSSPPHYRSSSFRFDYFQYSFLLDFLVIHNCCFVCDLPLLQFLFYSFLPFS